MVLGFGLIHGFGLSARLQRLPLPEEGLIERIIAFNVGVELGQIAALIVMMTILAAARRFALFGAFAKAANWALMAAGALLFLHQMHGWLHTRRPDNFGFPYDGHYHAHQAMDEDLARQREERDTLLPADQID
jgi:hypothetical protein